MEPPVLSNEEYERERAAGRVRIGHPTRGRLHFRGHVIEFDYTTSEPWTGGLKFPTLDHAFKYIDELETQKEVQDYLEAS
jgi:hypothetical protein